jgi:alpha-D-ribose 1-methylphosphonate 5-triphosphate synthase subunit PhnI
VLSLGYANMRGYGAVHPTVNELRLAYVPVTAKHPVTGVQFELGRIRTSLCEVVSSPLDHATHGQLQLGYCATLGWNEIKVLAGAMLDLAMNLPEPHPAHTEEFVLYHTEIVESSGFCIHYKLPHYVTFNSILDRLRKVRRENAEEGQAMAADPKDLMNQLNETGLPTRPSA